MKLFLASGNAHKAAEFQALARATRLPVEIVSAGAVGGMPAVEEDTGTFVGNARKKALALKAKVPADAWVLADDSGLCVDTLGGAPGVESAYYAGSRGDSAANLAKLVRTMRDIPPAERGARFVCVLVALVDGGREIVTEGRVKGTLLRDPRGGFGFGYDPLFVPEGFAESMAELSAEDKNRISHRGRAWQAMSEHLEKIRAGLADRP